MHTGRRCWLCVGAVWGVCDKFVQQSLSAKIVLDFHVTCLQTRNIFIFMGMDTTDI